MSFIFMNNAAIDGKSRKLIRSHVAKGKNLGRVLPPRRKRCEVGIKLVMPTREDRRGKNSFSIERQFGDGLSVYPIPNKLPPGSRSLVQKGQSFSNSDPIVLLLTASSVFIPQQPFLSARFVSCD